MRMYLAVVGDGRMYVFVQGLSYYCNQGGMEGHQASMEVVDEKGKDVDADYLDVFVDVDGMVSIYKYLLYESSPAFAGTYVLAGVVEGKGGLATESRSSGGADE